MAEETRPRLGRGLAALIGDAGDEAPAIERTRGQRRIPIEFLRPNPRNPRTVFGRTILRISPLRFGKRASFSPWSCAP